jgi:hypothetical protein
LNQNKFYIKFKQESSSNCFGKAEDIDPKLMSDQNDKALKINDFNDYIILKKSPSLWI